MTIGTEAASKLLYCEAHYLDTKQWGAWLDLYADDAIYWVPAMVSDEGWTDNPDNDVSLIYMDRAGLEARVFRIENRDSYATDPMPHTSHVVSNVLVHGEAQGVTEVSATWLVHSYLRVRGAVTRGGRYEVGLRETPDGLFIVRKKIFVYDDRIVGPLDIYNI